MDLTPAEHVMPPDAAATARPPHVRREHVHAAVSAAVHDRLVPEPLRGPAVDFAEKVAALARVVAGWSDRLKGRPEPEVQSLGRSLGRCPAYGDDVGSRHEVGGAASNARGPCGRRLCPHCFCRALDRHYRWLAWARKPFAHVHATSADLTSGPSYSREGMRHVRHSATRVLRGRRVSEYAVVRVALGVENNALRRWQTDLTVVVPSDEPVARAFWLPSIYTEERPLPDPGVFATDPDGMRAMVAGHLSYWEGLVRAEFADRLPEYLACVGRANEFSTLF